MCCNMELGQPAAHKPSEQSDILMVFLCSTMQISSAKRNFKRWMLCTSRFHKLTQSQHCEMIEKKICFFSLICIFRHSGGCFPLLIVAFVGIEPVFDLFFSARVSVCILESAHVAKSAASVDRIVDKIFRMILGGTDWKWATANEHRRNERNKLYFQFCLNSQYRFVIQWKF